VTKIVENWTWRSGTSARIDFGRSIMRPMRRCERAKVTAPSWNERLTMAKFSIRVSRVTRDRIRKLADVHGLTSEELVAAAVSSFGIGPLPPRPDDIGGIDRPTGECRHGQPHHERASCPSCEAEHDRATDLGHDYDCAIGWGDLCTCGVAPAGSACSGHSVD
jgi:hypothetical protein